ncbi:hypothetical protein BH09PAT1_BH09PAT1_0940 [soil metagenome]
MQKSVNANLTEYYSKRAQEYEAIYHRDIPIRLKEQDSIGKEIKKFFQKKYVLELACGTGYWTKYLLGSADKVLATDINVTMLEIASQRMREPEIQFLIGDAYNPPVSFPQFNGAMAHCWLSHIPKRKIPEFLDSMHGVLKENASVMFMDTVYRKELGGKLIKKKGSEDTWKRRTLENKEEFDILKNYYTKEELLNLFAAYSDDVSVTYLTHFWIVKYTLSKK